MITKSFQIILIVITSLNILLNIYYIKKMEMRIKYSLIWLTLSLLLLILAIFPKTIMFIAGVLNISSDTNTLYMMAISFLYIISFSFSIMFSRNSRKITTLVQYIAVLNRKIEKLEEKVNRIDS